jgi:hypothetical protein
MKPFESILIGAQSNRPPTPPARDWDRDLKTMAGSAWKIPSLSDELMIAK